MKIEIPIKWLQPITDPDALEEANTRRIISGGDEEESSPKMYEAAYDWMVIDTDDIASFHRYDDEHTIVRTRDIDSYSVRIPYEDFKHIYMETTGQIIHSLVVKQTKKRKPKL